jgi:sulfur dioxygenase
MKQDFMFFQLFEAESSTYTYIIADSLTKEAALIDSVLETAERDLKWIEDSGLSLKYVLDTHLHADHVTAADFLRKKTKAQAGISHRAKLDCTDIHLHEGQDLFLGNKKIAILETPGHTNSCLSFVFEGLVFTGDALLIRGCGRTDFQEGSAETLYESVHKKLFTLPDDTVVYPAHDYKGCTSTTIGIEKKHNPRLGMGRSKAEFVKIMKELKLDYPKKIDRALPANKACGKIIS